MTITDQSIGKDKPSTSDVQRFVFQEADWNFYEQVSSKLDEQRVFVTFYKGRLEIVTLSHQHERIVWLISQMIVVLAEETGTPLGPCGMSTLKRADLQEAIEPDSSFYIQHEEQMRGKNEIDLTTDPPPDLAIEVEVTRRLGQRRTIYRDLGVPELWVWRNDSLHFLLRRGQDYQTAEKSAVFGLLTAAELSQFVLAGLNQEGTAWIKSFRNRVRQVILDARQ